MDFAQLRARIKTLREGHQWTQEELARRAGVSKGTLSRIEAGKRGAKQMPPSLPAIADALGVSVDQLLRTPTENQHTPLPHRLQALAALAEAQLSTEDCAHLEGLIEGLLYRTRTRLSG